MSQKITCVYCGATNDYGANECAKCGAPLRYELKAGAQTVGEKVKEALLSLVATKTWEVNGCDISQHNGTINWDVLASKVDFAFIRYTYGNKGVDTQAERNVQMALDYGRPYAGYHYISPALDWRKNAQNFAQFIKAYGGEMLPLADFEETGGLNKTELESFVYKFGNETEQLSGEELAWYTSAGFLNTAIARTSWLKNKKLCVAHWTNADAPLLPLEWSIPGKTWEWWQHKVYRPGSDYGTQNAAIDLQRFNGTKAQFEDRYGPIGGMVTPPPVDPPAGGLQMRVIQAGLRIRNGPGTQYAEIGTLAAGQIVTTSDVGGQDSWVYIGPGQWANVQQGGDRNMEVV